MTIFTTRPPATSPIRRWVTGLGSAHDDKADAARSDADIRPSLTDLIELRAESHGLGVNLGSRVATTQAGGYVSVYKGRGIDFEETRIYQAGDDFRTVDWRVTARTGEPHTKVFREERERPVLFFVDQGASMLFGTRGRFKSVTAARAAALLAWAAVDNGDRVGGIIHTEHRQLELRATGRKLGALHLFKCIVSVNESPTAAKAPCQANIALTRLGQLARPGTLVFLISDFRGWNDASARIVRQISRRSELIAIVVHDTIEASAPPPNLYAVSNGTEFAAFDTRDREIVHNYERNFAERASMVKELCRSCNAQFLTLDGVKSIAPTLNKFLRQRARKHG